MTGEEIFDVWTPASSRWAAWAKPVLFTDLSVWDSAPALPPDWKVLDVDWIEGTGSNTFLVVDLPGAQSILYALRLAKAGFQPVPLFNCCSAYDEEVLSTFDLRDHLARGTGELQAIPLSSDAPPAFLLDANRLNGQLVPSPGFFDNRWMTFPQDFPSATFLKEAGYTGALLVQASSLAPQEDLKEVLLGWQRGGLRILAKSLNNPSVPALIELTSTSQFHWFFQRALAMARFRPNSAAGFGSVIPIPSSAAG
jgi:hypothetical protein